MMPPTSIDGTDISGATIDGTDVTEITVDGQTVFQAADFYGFEDGTYQGWTAHVDSDGVNTEFGIYSDSYTPTGNYSLGFYDFATGELAVVLSSPKSYDSYNISFKAYFEPDDQYAFEHIVGMSIFDTMPDGVDYTAANYTGWFFDFISSNGYVKEGGNTLGSFSVPQGNQEFIFEFSLDTSSNYTLTLKDFSNSIIESDSGSYNTASSTHNPNLICYTGYYNESYILVDDITIK